MTPTSKAGTWKATSLRPRSGAQLRGWRSGRASAFTLIEMIVVIVILALAAAIAIPRLSGGLLEREGLKSDVNRLAAVITHAREQAAATRRGHWLVLDVKNNLWRLRVVPRPDDPADSKPTLEGHLREGVTFKDVAVAGKELSEDRRAEVRFAADGWVDPAVITLASADGAAYSIAVSAPSGRVETFASRVTMDAQGVVTVVQ